jgi:hypothetical protein
MSHKGTRCSETLEDPDHRWLYSLERREAQLSIGGRGTLTDLPAQPTCALASELNPFAPWLIFLLFTVHLLGDMVDLHSAG